ncbi:hypothetical protein [Streptomyces hundungensis]|nr:hypothetical protein [Streptomyces hundungensis]
MRGTGGERLITDKGEKYYGGEGDHDNGHGSFWLDPHGDFTDRTNRAP